MQINLTLTAWEKPRVLKHPSLNMDVKYIAAPNLTNVSLSERICFNIPPWDSLRMGKQTQMKCQSSARECQVMNLVSDIEYLQSNSATPPSS